MAWFLCLCVFLVVALVLLAIQLMLRMSANGPQEPPCLPALPLIGSLLSLRSPHPPHVLFKELQEKYGQTYSLMMGSHSVIIVNQHKHAKEVLLKKGKIFAGRPRSVTTDVLTRDGKDIAFGDYSATWRFHRKIVHGALCMFGEGSASIEKIICAEAQSLCSVLSEAAAAGLALDLSPELTRAVTNVICSLCFNSSYRRGDPEFETMLRYSQGIVDTVAKDSLVDIFPWLQIFPSADLRLLKQCVSIRDKLLQKKYDEHKAEYSDHVQRDLLDALLRAKRSAENNNTAELSAESVGLSEDHLLMTVGDIFGAGVETTTTVLKWAVTYLIHHPQVQRRIQEELDIKVGRGRSPQLSDRGSLPYLEATIREVLRIRPVAPLFIPHVALSDTSIGDFTVRRGTRVIINLWSLHHDEKEWKDPELFDPGRFLNSEGTGLIIPSSSYLPFGAGVRVCLGEALAKMELFLFLSWILQHFILSVPPGHSLPSLEGKFGVVLQPAKYKRQLHAYTTVPNQREQGDNMPRSFLVKTQSSKKPSYGGVKPQTEEAPCISCKDSVLHSDVHPHHQRPSLSPQLQHRTQSLSSSFSSSSCSSSSSCALSLRTARQHLSSSPNTSPLSVLGPSSEAYGRSPSDAYKPEESCIRCVTGDHRRRESLLPPSLPLLALFPAVPPGGSSQEGFECLDCHKEYLSFSGLAKHKQLQCEWSSKKYFSCKYCEKEYVSLGALKMHIRTHTLPCVCKLCGKAFSRPWLLQGHIRTHTGEKPFSCLHCSRAFADRSNLRAHLQTHSEVKKYQCSSCFKTFSRISLLAKHQEAGCPVS
ncbi:steroid 17-alpha-hydroxylase/17,20 lyase [Toxotes jaculatrix]|uniref:steroid 17-alpha-hydroxylase/17,20 lyase n=1 Tax=Toxotes jaculatrix TaxID=941984 RepID=UPI001B3AAAAC|nr:steroid 17-alpha-hydroxylase/17,20 lyase [Toxotes jaculatrix]